MGRSHGEECHLNPFITIRASTGEASTSFIFTPECGCEDCEKLIDDFIEWAERLKEGCRDTGEVAELRDLITETGGIDG